MKPDFALSLSFEGISLLHRAADGWRSVGEVALETPDLASALADLRARAEALAPGRLRCKLILPNDQIRYLEVQTGPLRGDAARALVEAELANATPYQLHELAFDLEEHGSITRVAAVARETLQEAETFAVEHQFNPVSFTAIADPHAFEREPNFGLSDHAIALGVDKVLPESVPVVVVGPARIVDATEPPTALPIQTNQTEVSEASDSLKTTETLTPPVKEPKTTPPAVVPDVTPDTTPDLTLSTPSETPYESTQDKPEAQPDLPLTQPAVPATATDSAPAPMPGFSSRRRKRPLAEAAKVADHAAPASGAALSSSEAAPLEPTSPKAAPQKAGSSAREQPATPVAAPQVAAPKPPVPRPPAPIAASAAVPVENSAPRTSPVAKLLAGLSSLRALRSKPSAADPITAERAIAAPPPRPTGYPAATPNSTDAPQSETERMTVFGARPNQKIGGKPRFFGLFLTGALVLFLAAVAAWAALFSDFGIHGERKDTSDQLEHTLPPDGAQPDTATEPGTPAPPTTGAEETPLQAGEIPLAQDDALSSTDTAVLDALRDDSVNTEADAARYAATGIWPVAPDVPDTPAMIGLESIYFAAIDRSDMAQDAVALSDPGTTLTDTELGEVSSPPAPGTNFALDEDGLVIATTAGALSPDGITVYLGRPPSVPPEVPVRFETTPETEEVQDQYLAAFRPKPRPEGLVEENERANLDGKSLAELAALRPKARPQIAPKPDPEPEPEPQVTEDQPDEDPGFATATKQAVATSRKPKVRPRNMAALVRRAQPKATAAAVAGASTANVGSTGNGRTTGKNVSGASTRPAAPSPASVARQATLKNSINLSRLNLIGVYGTSSNRRALIRLPSGRYKKVKVGDLVDGGKIVAIGESELRYKKGSRNLTLKMPKG